MYKLKYKKNMEIVTTVNPNQMTGIFTNDGAIQANNAQELIQVMNKAAEISEGQAKIQMTSDVVNGIIGIVSTAALAWGVAYVMKSFHKGEKVEDK